VLKGVHTIIVQTSDMDRSVAFYRNVLQLEPGHASKWWSDFRLGTTRIGIHPIFEGNDAPAVIPFKNAIIGVEADDIGALRNRLEEHGDYVRGEYHDTPSGVVLDFVDPEGNNFQAIQIGVRSKDLA